MDICEENFFGSGTLREFHSRASTPVDESSSVGRLDYSFHPGMEDGDLETGDNDDQDGSMADSATPPGSSHSHEYESTINIPRTISQSKLSPPFSAVQPQPRNYRVVHTTVNTTADNTSQKKSLKLTLRAASPKEERIPSLSGEYSDHRLPISPNTYQHSGPAKHNNYITSQLNIITAETSSSSSASATDTDFYPAYQTDIYNAKVGHRNRVRSTATGRSVTGNTTTETVGSNINNNNKCSRITRSKVLHRRSGAAKPVVKASPVRASQSRRANTKRTSATGPTLNGYGVPASIESMSSMKDFINNENFLRFSEAQKQILAALLPPADCHKDEHGNVTISASALKNEYFSKSLEEYLNKGYRYAAMNSQHYPLSTGHNTRQRRRNEEQGVIDLTPKDKWKLTYFEASWGEKLPNFEKTSEAPPSDHTLHIKQPIVKLTRTDSASHEDGLLKIVTKSDPTDQDCTPPVTPDGALGIMETTVIRTPNSRANATVTGSSNVQAKSRKRRQREPHSDGLPSSLTHSESSAVCTRKRRRTKLTIPPHTYQSENQLCMALQPDTLASPATALSFVDDHAKGASSTKTGSASGPSNNSSSSPSTYGETSPPNEELGAHTSEFIKPRPPPPPGASVASVAAAAAAAVNPVAGVSLPGGSRDKYLSSNQFFGLVPTHLLNVSALPGVAVCRSGTPGTFYGCQPSRLNGKTLGELRRDIAYRYANRLPKQSAATASTSNIVSSVPLTQSPTTQTHSCASGIGAPSLGVNGDGMATVSAVRHAVPSQHNSPYLPPHLVQQLPQHGPVRPRRKYPLALRSFEHQLQLKEEKKSENPEDVALRRSKKSHEVRLFRVRERNRRLGRESAINSQSTSFPSTSSSQVAPSRPASIDWTTGPVGCRLGDESNGNCPQVTLATTSAHLAPSTIDSTCASSTVSSTFSTCVSSLPGRTHTSSRPSPSVVRIKDGTSIVFRDKLCGGTLASVYRRHPEANISLSFNVAPERLQQVKSDLNELAESCFAGSESDSPLPSLQLEWVIDSEKKTVDVSFVEAARLTTPPVSSASDVTGSCSPMLSSSSHTAVSVEVKDDDLNETLTPAVVGSGNKSDECWLSTAKSPNPVLVPSSATTDVVSSSSASDSHGISSQESHHLPDDEFLRDTADSQVFRGQQISCSKQQRTFSQTCISFPQASSPDYS